MRRGFTLLEVIVAVACLAMLAVPISGIMISVTRSAQLSLDKVGNQQATSLLTKQFLYDLRFNTGIYTALPQQLTLRDNATPSAGYIFYKLEGGYLKRGTSASRTPPTTWVSYPDPDSGATLSGGSFQYLDQRNAATTATDSICSASLTDCTLTGKDLSTAALPSMTVAAREAQYQEGGVLRLLDTDFPSGKIKRLLVENRSSSSVSIDAFRLVWEGAPASPELNAVIKHDSWWSTTSGAPTFNQGVVTVWSGTYGWQDGYTGNKTSLATPVVLNPNGVGDYTTPKVKGKSYSVHPDEAWFELNFSNPNPPVGNLKLNLYGGTATHAVSVTF